jgi:hypothetical protein
VGGGGTKLFGWIRDLAHLHTVGIERERISSDYSHTFSSSFGVFHSSWSVLNIRLPTLTNLYDSQVRITARARRRHPTGGTEAYVAVGWEQPGPKNGSRMFHRR